MKPLPASAAVQQPTGIDPLVWVWKFSADGPLPEIRDTLAANGLGIILKTHDGTSWMDEYDDSPDAISGPGQVSALASTFESAGVGFHAWCVVQGRDPIREAQMCADVLAAGARDLYLDLEPSEGNNYWQGSDADAVAFGEELRRLAPGAWIVVAPDARPWQAGSVPLAEFASFSNAIAPQAYWETFEGPTNRTKFAQHGYAVGPEGVTPELVIEASVGTFAAFQRPIYPIGQGASSPDKWRRFVASALSRGIGSMSLWRYGTADHAAFGVLKESKPPVEPLVVAPEPAQPLAVAPQAPTEPAAAAAPAQPDQAREAPSIDLPDTELLRLKASGQLHTAHAAPIDRSARVPGRTVLRSVDQIKDRVQSNVWRQAWELFR